MVTVTNEEIVIHLNHYSLLEIMRSLNSIASYQYYDPEQHVSRIEKRGFYLLNEIISESLDFLETQIKQQEEKERKGAT